MALTSVLTPSGSGSSMPAGTTVTPASMAPRTPHSVAALMLDVIGAFDAVIRECTLSTQPFDIDVARLLTSLGFGPEIMHDLANCIANNSIIRDSGISGHTAVLIAEAYQNTWYTT